MNSNYDPAALWTAVDLITRPSRRKIIRTPEHDPDTRPPWLLRLAADPTITVCDVTLYRAELRRAVAATDPWATIPSLWEQALDALGTGSETSDRAATPLRERSPADLDLMDVMLTVREFLGEFHRHRNERIVPAERVPASLRSLASAVVRHQPDDIGEWTARIEQWGRLLTTKLQAADAGPRPVRLRNSACPECGRRQVVLPTADGEKVFPPLLIDFTDGMIRAATCSGCGHVWWRGDELVELAERLERPAEPNAVFAPGA